MTVTSQARFDKISEYTYARNQLRNDPQIEQLILEHVARLPEESSRHFARESFQFGAGYAYSLIDDLISDEVFVCDEAGESNIAPMLAEAFFKTLPRNRHQHPEVVKEYEQTVAHLVAQAYADHAVKPLHPSIDAYQFEAFVAFIEGYQLVATHRIALKHANYRPAPV